MCRSLLLCLLLVGPGCSYAFVHGPSARYETPSGPAQGVSCTTSNAAPAVDTVLAIPFILAGGARGRGGAAPGGRAIGHRGWRCCWRCIGSCRAPDLGDGLGYGTWQDWM